MRRSKHSRNTIEASKAVATLPSVNRNHAAAELAQLAVTFDARSGARAGGKAGIGNDEVRAARLLAPRHRLCQGGGECPLRGRPFGRTRAATTE